MSEKKRNTKPAGTRKRQPAAGRNKSAAPRAKAKVPARPAAKNTKAKQTRPAGSAKTAKPAKTAGPSKPKQPALPVRVIPLGGLHEIGKNMTAIEYDNEIMIIDCGLSFPDDDMFGIDKVIPDFTYLRETDKKILGLVITHGHEDHIGGIPFLLKELNVPIYGMRFPLGLIQNKLDEHGLKADMHYIEAGDIFPLGRYFRVEAQRITHSIADSICLKIDTPAGAIFHTGDFKIDYTPVDGNKIDFGRLAQIGNEGVLLMMADSTNVMRQGFTRSEMKVGETLDIIFRSARSRIIVATFSSNVHRIQKIIDIALECNRKVAISGRSMVNVFELAKELGYIRIPDHMLVDLNRTKNIPDDQLVIITTGSQGEPMSALARMASMEHKTIRIKPGDMVILSSTPVPGNELTVSNVVDQLIEKGAEVIYSDIAETHVSGHACREELKLMHSLIRPKFFMPVHGEYRFLQKHAQLAEYLGMDPKNIFLLDNGDALSVTSAKAEKTEKAVPADPVMVDGLGVGDVGNIVLRDRRLLSESGLVILVAAIDGSDRRLVAGPDIITRGFVYARENEDLIDEACRIAEDCIVTCLSRGMSDWNAIKTKVREELRKFIYQKTKRTPIILPVFQEV
ncbi:MAG: RNase J family beta-CASP ribonuclease [Firmicutes bacterium]|nr:RNase J family beta-CASP ribonuclease [Bacillota bacterium]